MAISVTVRQGGASAASTVDFSDQVRVFDAKGVPLLTAAMAYNNGQASQYQVVIDDDANTIAVGGTPGQLGAHNVVTIIEDAPGSDVWLSRGRIASHEMYRGDVHHGIARTYTTLVDDANVDLRGLTLVEDWVRATESGRARVLAALAAFCNGAPRPSTVIATDLVAVGNEVTMPAKTYPAGTDLIQIFADCASTEGKVFGVVIHHDAASHLCFLYIQEDDHTTYASTLSITDDNPDLSDSYPPIWDQGPATIEELQEGLTGLVSRWGFGDEFVFTENVSDVAVQDYWVGSYNDTVSVTAIQALTRAQNIRESRDASHQTHQVSIKIPADKVDLLCAGMSISFQAAAAIGGPNVGTAVDRRIAQLKWEPIAPDGGGEGGFYYAHMQLDRTPPLLPEPAGIQTGPAPPAIEQLWEAAICDPEVVLTTGTWLLWLTSETGLAITGTDGADYNQYGSGLLRVVRIFSDAETVSITSGFIMALKVPDKDDSYYQCGV